MAPISDLTDSISTLSLHPSAESVAVFVKHQGEQHQLTLVGDIRDGLSSIRSALGRETPLAVQLGSGIDLLVQSPKFVSLYGALLSSVMAISPTRLTLRTRSAAVYLLSPTLRSFGDSARVKVPIETPNHQLSSLLLPTKGAQLADRIALLSKLRASGIAATAEVVPIFKGLAQAKEYAAFLDTLETAAEFAPPHNIESELRLLNRRVEENQVLCRMISRSVRLNDRFCQLIEDRVESGHESTTWQLGADKNECAKLA